jgi:oligoribonuclease NrnB/cAMP/cGMP phosphodiesterase (DHH superfamily)
MRISDVRVAPPSPSAAPAAPAAASSPPSEPKETFTRASGETGDGAQFDHKYSARYPDNPHLATAFSLTPGAVTHVLYHANCPDGFGAALAAWETLGDKAKYIPVKYDQPPPELPKDAKVAIVDFSYPRDQLLDLKSKVSDLVVLDHHESAQRNLEGLPFAYFPPTWPSKDGKGDPGHSGATLSWLYFHHDEPIPDFWLYLRDRDNWQWQLPESRAFSTGLASHEMEFRGWDQVARHVDSVVSEGTTIERFKDRLVDEICAGAKPVDILGHTVPVVNGPYELASDIGEALKKKNPDAPFVAIYYDGKDGTRGYSLRSEDFDVSKIAEQFGGGGHEHAAAFRVSSPAIDLSGPPAKG